MCQELSKTSHTRVSCSVLTLTLLGHTSIPIFLLRMGKLGLGEGGQLAQGHTPSWCRRQVLEPGDPQSPDSEAPCLWPARVTGAVLPEPPDSWAQRGVAGVPKGTVAGTSCPSPPVGRDSHKLRSIPVWAGISRSPFRSDLGFWRIPVLCGTK